MAVVATLTNPRRGGFDALLKQGALVKQKVAEITDKFATGPNSPLAELTVAEPQCTSLVVAQSPVEAKADSGDVDAEEDQFKEAMREYEKEAEPKYKTGVDPDAQHSVKQLLEVIDDEIAAYHSKDKKGFWGRIRMAFRKLGSGSEALQGWLGLLPTESNYLSVVCGGLKLILQAAARMRKVAQEVLDALCKIPVIISSTRRVLNIFRESQELGQKSKALYRSILGGLGHMLEYLRRSTVRKSLMAGLKQQSFESGLLDDWIGNITKDRDSFNDEAEMCHKEAVQKLQKIGEKNTNDIKQQIRDISVVIEAAREENKRAQNALADGMQLLVMGTAELRDTFREEIERLGGYIEKRMFELLTASPKVEDLVSSWNKRLDTPEYVVERRPPRRASVVSIVRAKKDSETPSQQRRTLLSRLDYDPDAVAADVETNFRLGSDLALEDQERSLFVIKSGTLADWVSPRHSTALIIHGNARRVARKSALSFVCARIVCALDRIIQAPGPTSPTGKTRAGIPAIVSLHFFCGQHVQHRQSWESPAGVVNSLLAQLMTQCKKADLSRAAKLGDFDSEDVEGVMARFEKVLGRLPAGSTVFCVVDALSFYVDDDETQGDAEYLIRRLVELAGEKSKKKPVFKLLLAAPRRLRVSNESLGESAVLTVPATLPKTGGFTAMKWKVGVGKHFDALGG